MLTVHHLNNSRSQRVLWMLEELGVPYDVRRYERDPKTGWFVGECFSAADIQMSFPLEATTARGTAPGQWPAIADFLQRIHARDAYQRALARGGPYELLS